MMIILRREKKRMLSRRQIISPFWFPRWFCNSDSWVLSFLLFDGCRVGLLCWDLQECRSLTITQQHQLVHGH